MHKETAEETMRKPPSLKTYATAVLAVIEGNLQGNYEETLSFLPRKLLPLKVSSKFPPRKLKVSFQETQKAVAAITRQAALIRARITISGV